MNLVYMLLCAVGGVDGGLLLAAYRLRATAPMLSTLKVIILGGGGPDPKPPAK